MKKKLSFYICISFILVGHTQENNQGIVYYGHKESFGMGAPIGLDYNAYLVFNSNTSTYVSQKDSLEGGPVKEFVRIKTEDKRLFVHTKITNTHGFIHHVDRKKGLFISRDIGFRYVKQSIPKIKWNIGKETKVIGNLKCYKATTGFRGREYTAWFTLEIPLPFGPWKLQGLPGLILEAYDTNKEVYFYFKSIKYPTTKNIPIIKPNPVAENKHWITFEEYRTQLYDTHRKRIENGRLMIEQAGIDSEENKASMKISYIEVFDNLQ
ncbi:GLPGLI family protein [Ascidiimonas aurantiaca]|uniref:GLPGLI family protein n=1 Tax=Ascidiimonas aurantiaca TaxID=1685432 RepID=UPI0030ED21CB